MYFANDIGYPEPELKRPCFFSRVFRKLRMPRDTVWKSGGFPACPNCGVTATSKCGADRCIDAWMQSGGVQNPMTGRRHDLSDGFALVGFRSGKTMLEGSEDDGHDCAAMVRGNVIEKERFEKIRACEGNRGAAFVVAEDDGDHVYMSLKREGEMQFVKIA